MGDAIVLRMPARAEYLLLARLALAGVGRAAAVDDGVLADLKLAVTEACGNAVRHAYADGDGVVRVEIGLEADEVTIRVEDNGRGVDATPLSPAEDGLGDEGGGMGLEIIRAIADEVDVASGPDGTTVVMRKALGRASAVT